tara:strand:+ start:934 stop:1446 length:513 start_codon:yes stop_codon:yes gene_type:complete
MYVNNCNNDSHPPPPGDGSPQNPPPGGGGDSAGSGDDSSATTSELICSHYPKSDDNDYNNIEWNRKIDGNCVKVNSSLNIPYFTTEYYYDESELFNPGERPVKDELEKERRLINDTIYKRNTKYDKTSDTAQTRSFKIHNKSINVVIGILFSILIILVIYLVIKLFGLLK